MDITVNELKTMKAKQLRRIIREAIDEVIKEGPAEEAAAKAAKIKALQAQKKAVDSELSAVTSGKDSVTEMSRPAKGFRLANPQFDATRYANKRVSGISLADVIEYFRENPGAEKSDLQDQFNFIRPQIANAVANALLDAGVLVKLGAGGEEEAPVAPGEAPVQQAVDPEDMFMGGAENPLAMYFDNVPNDNGDEDFNDSEEPTAGDLEKAEKPAMSMSDEDYESWMQYDTLKNRLDATKSNILKVKRSKGSGASDIEDKPSDELLRLRDLKASLQNRMDKLIQGSDYLKKKVEKETGKPVAFTTVIEPEDEEETIAESFDDYDMRKRQYYACIKK